MGRESRKIDQKINVSKESIIEEKTSSENLPWPLFAKEGKPV